MARDPSKFGVARRILIGGQGLATILFLIQFQSVHGTQLVGWLVPLAILSLIAINSVWPMRITCWIIFSVSFFCFMVILSAFTLRWRMETGFDPRPFYRTMILYIVFIYVSLGQLKIYVGGSSPKSLPSGGEK